MKHEIILIMAAVLCGLSFCAAPAHAKYGGGSGTAEDPYLIYDANQMNAIGADSNDWDKHFLLMADIDLSTFTGTNFNIIGSYGNPFTGVFDGNDHTISNFTYTTTGTDYIGIFRCLRWGAEIKNLGLIDPIVDAGTGRYVGSLVGYLKDGTITGCYVEGGSVAGNYRVGGLVGYNRWGTIINSYSAGRVTGTDWDVGGLVGGNWQGTITNCYATGSVSGNKYVGGLVGQNYYGTITNGTISNCYSTGSVAGVWYVGGLVGYNWGTITSCYAAGSVSGEDYVGGLVGINSDTIINSYSTGSVSGYARVGGLVGQNGKWGWWWWVPGKIVNSYSSGHVVGEYQVGGLVGYSGGEVAGVMDSFWDIETSGQTTSACGTGLPTAEMQTMSTFTNAGWDFENIWWILEGAGYPRLCWEEKYGGGSGQPDNPYLIYTAEQMNTIGACQCDWDKHFLLCADIDLSGYTGTNFNIIGIDYYNPFSGVFDGSGHTISNFTYTSTDGIGVGLFGYVDDPNAHIKNLGLIAPDVDAGTGGVVGALVGWLRKGTITNCYVEGGSVSEGSFVGGLVGDTFYGTITNCYSQGSVSGAFPVGGLVGINSGTISNSYSTASVSGDWDVGGLVGLNYGTISNCYSSSHVSGSHDIGGLVGWNNSGTISNCYSSGDISGDWAVGGLVGWNHYGTITNCYSTGSVSGGLHVGGLVGDNRYGTITNCYSTGSVTGYHNVGGLVGWNWGTVTASFWDTQTSGQSTSAGGTGKTTTAMQTMSTFTDAGWDFVGETVNGTDDIWFIPEGDYPHLWWEGMQVLMKLTPRTLNCRSYGNWVKAHLTLPEGFTVADVDSNRPAVLHSFGFESAPLYVFVNKNERVQIEAAFEREAVCSLTGDWPEALTVAGFLTDGNIFLGTSKVRMITPGMKDIEELALYWLNADCVQPDFCDEIDMNRDSTVNLLDYALLLNSQVEFVSE